MPRRYSVRRPRWRGLCGAALAVAWAGTAVAADLPSLLSGRIDTPTLRLSTTQLSPKVTLDIRGVAEAVTFTWTGPGGQTLDQGFGSGAPSGRHVFQAVPGFGATLSPYAQAGLWTLSDVEVCREYGGPCTDYSGATLSALFHALNVMVINPKADITPPTATSASILTPVIKSSPSAKCEISMTAQDDSSGFVSGEVIFTLAGSKDQPSCGAYPSHPVVASEETITKVELNLRKVTPGAYSATTVRLRDAAGNAVAITDPAAISALFGGQTTLTIQ